MVAAAIGDGDGLDLHRCRGVEHEVHNFPAKYGGSLAHEFDDSFLAVGLKPGTVRDPNLTLTNDWIWAGQRASRKMRQAVSGCLK